MNLFPSDEDNSPTPSASGFSREIIDDVWEQAETIPGNDDGLWRKDVNGTWINRMDYGKRSSQFGWEIEEKGAELRPVQWESSKTQSEPEDEEDEDPLLF